MIQIADKLHCARCIRPALKLTLSAFNEVTDGIAQVPDNLLYYQLEIAIGYKKMAYCAPEDRAA